MHIMNAFDTSIAFFAPKRICAHNTRILRIFDICVKHQNDA